MSRHDITITVNGRTRTVSVEARRLLVDVLRQELGLPGTHSGCDHGVCGSCTRGGRLVCRDGPVFDQPPGLSSH